MLKTSFGKRNKLIISIVLLISLMLLVVPMVTFADSIADRVNQAQGGDNVSALQEKANEIGESFINFLRTMAIMVAVIMFVIVAYGLLFSPNVRTIADMKGRVGALVLAILIAVMAEQIVGTLLSWVGYTV